MAGPAAVPGVDPSRVSTPDELAACLDGLRRRRGLSYEAMEKAVAKLPPRSGRSRPDPLPKSTVGEIVTGKRLPTRGKLLTFLTVCEVAPADRAQWLAAWERASTADLARPAGAVRVRDARPRLLGVHAAIQVEEKVPGELPVYVPRDIDDRLHAELAANAQRGCFVLLIGGSSVGKTRTLYEAVLAALPDWWVVHPAGPDEVSALAAAPSPRTVVWLDELQRYLDGEHGLTGAVVRALLNAPHPAVIIGTIWPNRYTTYTAVPVHGGADPHAREREVLDLAAVIRVGLEFSPTEQDRARAAAARDPRLKVALDTTDYGLTQTLAAAPQLVARWQDAKTADPYAWAVLTAALDTARLGAHTPLSAEFLRAAAPGYCTSREQAEPPGDWFEQALVYATGKLHGAAAALSPAGVGMGQVAGYTAADYLIQHASRERRSTRVPASTWDAILSHIEDPDDTTRLADSARARLLYRYAIPLYRRATDAGDGGAAAWLAGLLADRGDLDGAEQILRARADADADDFDAAARLVDLLADRGDLAGLRAWADTGDGYVPAGLTNSGEKYAAMRLDGLLAEHGDMDGLRARADAGDQTAARLLADLLADRGDLDGLRARADADDEWAAARLPRLLADRGDLEGLRARADAGDQSAARLLADLLAQRGDLDGAAQILRGRADVGDWHASERLADLLADQGDLDGLRARADVGDWHAATRLTDLLADRGDLDGLRARADAGDKWASERLPRLLAEHGDLDGAAQILRARADAGDEWASERLADLLAQHGDLDGAAQILRHHADAGNFGAARRLTDLLAQRGHLDEAEQILRHHADAGDDAAAWQLADLLADRGDLDGLRARADAGRAIGERLADLLAQQLIKQGRGEEAELLRRFGLNPDGSIASGGRSCLKVPGTAQRTQLGAVSGIERFST